MSNSKKISKKYAVKYITTECKCDDVGLWEFVNRVKDMGFKGVDIKTETLSLVKELLDDRLIVAGEPAGKGKFRVFKKSSDEIISFIDDEWNKLSKEPGIADIIWFSSAEDPDGILV